jgi:hypothetical protein
MPGLTETQRNEFNEQMQEHAASRRQREAAEQQAEKAGKHSFARGFLKGMTTVGSAYLGVSMKAGNKPFEKIGNKDARRQIDTSDVKAAQPKSKDKEADDDLSY